MPKNLDSPVEWIFLGLLIVMMVAVAIASTEAEKALDNPDDSSRVFLDQLPSLSMLSGAGPFRISIFRQSGYLHAEYVATGASQALTQAMSTFRRAKIEAIRISSNGPDRLAFNRLFYNHRGSSEGKRISSVEIVKIG